jgi:hypothetical protein
MVLGGARPCHAGHGLGAWREHSFLRISQCLLKTDGLLDFETHFPIKYCLTGGGRPC